MKTLSYANIADIAMCGDSGEMTPPRQPGDMTEACDLAEAILRRWARVAAFNIGAAQTLRIIERVATDLDEVGPCPP